MALKVTWILPIFWLKAFLAVLVKVRNFWPKSPKLVLVKNLAQVLTSYKNIHVYTYSSCKYTNEVKEIYTVWQIKLREDFFAYSSVFLLDKLGQMFQILFGLGRYVGTMLIAWCLVYQP